MLGPGTYIQVHATVADARKRGVGACVECGEVACPGTCAPHKHRNSGEFDHPRRRGRLPPQVDAHDQDAWHAGSLLAPAPVTAATANGTSTGSDKAGEGSGAAANSKQQAAAGHPADPPDPARDELFESLLESLKSQPDAWTSRGWQV